MSEALNTAVTEMNASLQKMFVEKGKKKTKHDEFKKKWDELKNAKKERDFDKKKAECDAALKASLEAANSQRQLTLEVGAKITAAKAKLTEEKQQLAARKKAWNEQVEKAKAHNELVKQLNPAGPDRDKLMRKIDEKVSEAIIENELDLLETQNLIDEKETHIKNSHEGQKIFREILVAGREKLTNKEFQAKKK